MSPFRRESYFLIADRDEWTIFRRSSLPNHVVNFEAVHHGRELVFSADGRDSFRRVAATFRAMNRAELNITLGSALSKGFTFKPPAGLRSLRELRAIATGRFEQLFGESASDWELAGDWDVRDPIPVCAFRKTWIAALQGMARDLDLTLTSLRAAWSRGLSLSGKPPGYLAIAERYSTTFILRDAQGKVADLRIYALQNETTLDQSACLLERQILMNGLDSSTPVLWSGSAAWLNESAQSPRKLSTLRDAGSPIWWLQ